MITVTFVEVAGREHQVTATPGESVMSVARSEGIQGILADCGGSLACGTCHVHVAPAWVDLVGPPGEVEAALLEMAIDPDSTSRLACQIVLEEKLDGLVVNLPPSQV